MPPATKRRLNDDGSVNLEGYSPYAARIHKRDIRRLPLTRFPDGALREEGPGPKVYLIYTPTIGPCVLKEFIIPHPLSSLSIDPNLTNEEKLKMKYQDREIQYSSAIDSHPNILRFFGYAVTDTHVEGLITEYMSQGSLATVEMSLCTPDRITNWALQVARALAYCHQVNIVHRDIKPDNVLLAEDRETVKLCDFEFAKPMSHDMTKNVGSQGYQAPEVIDSTNYNFKADVWSYGMFLYAMAENKLPKIGDVKGSQDLKQKLMEGKRPKVEPKPGFDLIYGIMEHCWQTEPGDRPDMIEIVKLLDPFSANF